MMKGKRLLSVILTLVMTVSLLTGITVNAAAPLSFEGATSVLFDQSFAGLKSAEDAPDFTFKDGNGGTWTFADYFAISKKTDGTATAAYVVTKNSYDLTDASGFELVVKAECTSNGININMPGGYVLKWHNNTGALVSGKNKMLALTKDGAVLAADSNGNVPYVYVDVYGDDTTYVIKYLDGVWNVEAITTTAEKTGAAPASFTWKDDSNPTFNGTFGIAANWTEKFTVYNMKLTKFARTATVNHWKYATDFKSTDEHADYVAEGLTLPSAMSFNNGYVQVKTNGYITYTYSPNGQKPSGDYGFTFDQGGANENARQIRFNYIDANNCYELFIYHKAGAIDVSADVVASDGYPAADGWVLRKISGGKKTTLATQNLAGTSFEQAGTRFAYNIKVTNVDAGRKIDVTVTLPASTNTAPLTMTATDTSPFEQNGTINMLSNYPGTNTKLYSFNAYSLVSENDQGESITYSETLVDEGEFKNADLAGLATLNFSTSTNATTLTKESAGDLRFYNAGAQLFTLTYNGDLSGSYDFETTINRNNNDGYINFSKNGSYFYRMYIKGGGSPYTINLKKICGTNSYDFPETTATYTGEFSDIGRGNDFKFNVSVRPNAAGDVAISVVINTNGKTINLSATDYAANPLGGVAPYTGGKVDIIQGYCNEAYVKSFAAYKTITETLGASGNVPEYYAVFYNDNGAIKEVSPGTIYFEYPVARLGTYTAIATLHENNEMTGIKVISPLELYSGKVRLFDVTDAANAKVRVYFFDAEDSLNRITEVYELN